MTYLPRQNYHSDSEAGVNKQINMELYASYLYQAMSFNFKRDDIALPGCGDYFSKRSMEEREHAEKLMSYQNMRGGRIMLQAIVAPDVKEWLTPLSAMEAALTMEKKINQSIIDLHEIALKHKDSQMTDFLEGNYLGEQVKDIKELSDNITRLKRCGTGLGEYMFDKQLSS